MYQNAVKNNKMINIINSFTVAYLEQMAFSKSIKTVPKQLKRMKVHIFKDAEALNSSDLFSQQMCIFQLLNSPDAY